MWQYHYSGKDKFSYANQSYVFPVAVVSNALSAAVDGKDPWDSFKGFAQAMGDQFLGDGGLIIGPAVEAGMNRNEWDAQSVRGEASRNRLSSEYIKGVGGHFVERAFLPAFIPQAAKWMKAARQEPGRDGQVYTLSDRLDRLVGM
ncbi:hypothetical protein OEZ84_27420, partial [Leclercia adecarboxylata]|uniref:hypothetical protein n=1 Tax=Leclercia adecarboxylata TaxID=83655 RepID=UPI00234DD003